jgi:hypothetical protein
MKTKVSLLLFIFVLLITSNNAFGSAIDSSGFFPLILNWKQTEIKTYNSSNLYNPIDGAADLFLRYNFEEMLSTEYHSDTNYITIEVYRHKTPIDAFGIYSQEKPDRNIYVSIGVQGYKEDDYLNFLTGCFYVKMRVWKVNQNSLAAMNEIALKLAASLNNNTTYPKIFNTFPSDGKIPFTDKYISRDVLGYNFLHSSFQVDYNSDAGKKFTIFVIKGSSEKDALAMLTSYFKFLKQPTNDLSDGLYQVYDPHNGLITILKSGLYLLCIRGDNTMENSIRLLNDMKVKIDLLKE